MTTRFRVPAERELPPGRLSERRAHLVEELRRLETGPAGGGARLRRRWATLVLAPVAAVMVSVAAYAVIARAPDEVVNGIGCYAGASTNADTTIVASGHRDPVGVCAELWKRGAVVAGVTEVPPLVPCVPASGQAVWVFPGGEETCAKLGLGPLPGGYRQAAVRFAAMRQELVRRFGTETCLTEAQARTIVRHVLDNRGFTDWVVEEGPGIGGEGFSETRPCAGLAIDPSGRAVVLVPEERTSPAQARAGG
jgi:hypothetical protein